MFGKWVLVESLIHFFRNSFIPDPWEMFIVECYIYIGYRAIKLQKKFIRLAILYATVIKFDNSTFFNCIYYLLPNSINENRELYFHTQ